MIAGLERDQRRVEGDQQKQEREPDDPGDEQRQPVLDKLALVVERGRDAADVGGDTGAAERLRQDVLAQVWTRSGVASSCGEVVGITVMIAAVAVFA